eukprot:6477514-Amphidinium_carterae.1
MAVQRKVLSASEDASMYGTHSCKRTTLHWAARANLSLDSRRLLGNHVVKSDGSWLAYSVDGLSGPIKELKTVLNMVGERKLAVVGQEQTGHVEMEPDSSSKWIGDYQVEFLIGASCTGPCRREPGLP